LQLRLAKEFELLYVLGESVRNGIQNLLFSFKNKLIARCDIFAFEAI